MRALTLPTLACCLLSGCACGVPPMPAAPLKVPPPAALLTRPAPLPPPASGRMADLESNHRQVAHQYHRLAQDMCLLQAWVTETPPDDCAPAAPATE